MNGLLLARLLQLASPALPVGAYTYSQGLEWAIETGVVSDEASAARWISDVLEHSLGAYELPLLFALAKEWQEHDAPAVSLLNADYLATREGAELLPKRPRWAIRCSACSANFLKWTIVVGQR